MSHTPGPWINDRSHPEWERNVVWSGDMVVARVVDDQHANADANARLIAAAPDLLAALIRMDEEFGTQNYTKSADDAVIMAQAAIKKATGGE